MATISFSDKKNAQKKLEKELALIDNSYVLVGFQEGSQTKTENKNNRTKKGGFSMPQIAGANEFGTENIPARPFMRPSFDENITSIEKVISKQYVRIQNGETTVSKALGLIGLYMTDLVQKKILSIHTPPNSPRTIAIKKSSKPLIDFGQMFDSVTHKTVIK